MQTDETMRATAPHAGSVEPPAGEPSSDAGMTDNIQDTQGTQDTQDTDTPAFIRFTTRTLHARCTHTARSYVPVTFTEPCVSSVTF